MVVEYLDEMRLKHGGGVRSCRLEHIAVSRQPQRDHADTHRLIVRHHCCRAAL